MFTNRPPRSAGIQAKMLTIILPMIAAPMLILAAVGFFTANREAANSSARYLAQREADLRAPTLGDHVLLSSMLAYVGINRSTVNWVKGPTFADGLRLFVEGKADAYMAFAPQGQELRAKKIGRVIVDTAQDRPWSQYYCCVAIGHRDFVRAHPVAMKRALRALLKATDLCAQRPEGLRAYSPRKATRRAATALWKCSRVCHTTAGEMRMQRTRCASTPTACTKSG